jgi:hypothetical protein
MINRVLIFLVHWGILFCGFLSMPFAGPSVSEKPAAVISLSNQEKWPEILEKARQKALQYSEELPNFICLQTTRRLRKGGGMYQPSTTRNPAEWLAVDQFIDELAYVNHREEYKRADTEKTREGLGNLGIMGGASSQGEFGSTLHALFDPASRAEFKMEGISKLDGRNAIRAKFYITRENSELNLKFRWNLDPPFSQIVGYKGCCWIDLETLQTVRLEQETSDVTRDFPISKSSWIIVYKLQEIAGRQYWLPAAAEFHQWTSGSKVLPASEKYCEFRNIMKFDHYRKYESEVNIVP